MEILVCIWKSLLFCSSNVEWVGTNRFCIRWCSWWWFRSFRPVLPTRASRETNLVPSQTVTSLVLGLTTKPWIRIKTWRQARGHLPTTGDVRISNKNSIRFFWVFRHPRHPRGWVSLDWFRTNKSRVTVISWNSNWITTSRENNQMARILPKYAVEGIMPVTWSRNIPWLAVGYSTWIDG